MKHSTVHSNRSKHEYKIFFVSLGSDLRDTVCVTEKRGVEWVTRRGGLSLTVRDLVVRGGNGFLRGVFRFGSY